MSLTHPLHAGWELLAPDQRRHVREHYRKDRRKGFSVFDARYFANWLIDVHLDDQATA